MKEWIQPGPLVPAEPLRYSLLGLVETEHLREMAAAARDEAIARERDAFQARWGAFWKCAACGARLDELRLAGREGFRIAWPIDGGAPVVSPDARACCACGARDFIAAGYTR